MEVPTVTRDDLSAFHARTFGFPTPRSSLPDETNPKAAKPDPQSAFEQDPEHEGCFDEEDDGLGYYPDGVKRTLTDEQVAMFRHSEIYAILRARQVARENEDLDCGEDEGEEDVTAIGEGRGEVVENVEDGETSPSHLDGYIPTKDDVFDYLDDCSSPPIPTLQDQQKSGNPAPKPVDPLRNPGQYPPRHEKRKRKRHDLEQGEDQNSIINSKIRERGRIRELDASFAEEQVLEYGDEVATETEEAQQQAVEPTRAEGKKIWWPFLSSG